MSLTSKVRRRRYSVLEATKLPEALVLYYSQFVSKDMLRWHSVIPFPFRFFLKYLKTFWSVTSYSLTVSQQYSVDNSNSKRPHPWFIHCSLFVALFCRKKCFEVALNNSKKIGLLLVALLIIGKSTETSSFPLKEIL